MTNLRKYFPILAIGTFYLWSLISVSLVRRENAQEGTIILRIGHQQLEPGVREGFELMAAEYQKLHPNVRIVQDAIPETTYGQWVTTQLIGGTAPDILQVQTGGLPDQVWLTYYLRYILPLNEVVSQANPYNEGTNLENLPLRSTYPDGMRLSYNDEMQEFVSIPLSRHGQRVFYNKTLLRKLTNLESPPSDFRQFVGLCERVKGMKDERGRNYIPVVGSKYHFNMWERMLCDPLTYPAIYKADSNRDARLGRDELFAMVRIGQIDLQHPAFQAYLKMAKKLGELFQSGYPGLNRDDGMLLFSQNRAIFLAAGTWEAKGVEQQAEGMFELGVMDFPNPTREDPEFGAVVWGPRFEVSASLFNFSVTRTSKCPEVAVDFLRFMTGQRQNELLNRTIGWLPAIIGANATDSLKPFEPNNEGIYKALELRMGSETWVKFEQDFSLLQLGLIDPQEFVKRFEPYYKEQGLEDFENLQRDWVRGFARSEATAAGLRSRALFDEDEKDAEVAWMRYRIFSQRRMVWVDLLHRESFVRMVTEGKPPPEWRSPYEYKPEAIDRLKKEYLRKL